jgi:hypothetical protein
VISACLLVAAGSTQGKDPSAAPPQRSVFRQGGERNQVQQHGLTPTGYPLSVYCNDRTAAFWLAAVPPDVLHLSQNTGTAPWVSRWCVNCVVDQ